MRHKTTRIDAIFNRMVKDLSKKTTRKEWQKMEIEEAQNFFHQPIRELKRRKAK